MLKACVIASSERANLRVNGNRRGAEDKKCVIVILIDEIQYFNRIELGALIMAMHKVQQRQLPIVLFGAGLPILPGLAGASKSYAERLFSFPDIGALSEVDAAKPFQLLSNLPRVVLGSMLKMIAR